MQYSFSIYRQDNPQAPVKHFAVELETLMCCLTEIQAYADKKGLSVKLGRGAGEFILTDNMVNHDYFTISQHFRG